MKQKIILSIAILSFLSLAVFVSAEDYVLSENYDNIIFRESEDLTTDQNVFSNIFEGFIEGERASYYDETTGTDILVYINKFDHEIEFKEFDEKFTNNFTNQLGDNVIKEYIDPPRGENILFIQITLSAPDETKISVWVYNNLLIYFYLQDDDVDYQSYDSLYDEYWSKYPSTLKAESMGEAEPNCYCTLKDIEWVMCELSDGTFEQDPCPKGCQSGKCLEQSEEEIIDPDEKPIEIPEEIIEEDRELVCIGCVKEEKCYPLGYRKSGEYCSENSEFIVQLEAENSCENNFECDSNLCINQECVSGSLWVKFMRWLSKLFG